MSRLLTMSELYALLLDFPDLGISAQNSGDEKNARVMQLNHQSPIFWEKPQGASVGLSRRTSQPKSPHQVQVAGRLLDLMHHVAQASGLSENEAWSNAAQTWIAQRQHDMQELASPAGRELARAVQHVWSTIDEQMRDLRNEKPR